MIDRISVAPDSVVPAPRVKGDAKDAKRKLPLSGGTVPLGIDADPPLSVFPLLSLIRDGVRGGQPVRAGVEESELRHDDRLSGLTRNDVPMEPG